ncbi:MAG: PAS domain S-box protein [Cytophagales bacterium]|nr:PAS domain S-box protein [Rhizobacter sp.]
MRTAALAILNPDTRIEIAHRQTWLGQLAAAVVPGFSMQRFERVTQGTLADVEFGADGLGLSVMAPFAVLSGPTQLRSHQRGAVILSYDLRAEHAALRARQLRSHVPELLGALVLIVLLPLLLQRVVTRPLTALSEASRRLAGAPGAPPEPVPETGSAEVAQLARSFNEMARTVQVAQAGLAQSEFRLRATFELAAIGIAHVATDGRFLRVNRRLCDMLGYSSEQLLRMSAQMVTHPDDLEGDLVLLCRLMDGQVLSYTSEKRYRHANGEIVWGSLNVAAVHGEGPAPEFFISVIEDITARKLAAAALLVAQAAEQANASKTEFLSRMSHELRTPLNAVLGFAQILQLDSTESLSTNQRAKVRHIANAGTHLLAMIDDVLDLSRIDSGNMRVTLQSVPVAGLVDESLALVSAWADEANVRIVLEPLDDHAGNFVIADPLRLRQALVNLLSNAIKYNRRGGLITVRWHADAGQGGRIHLSVHDTGRGLSEDQLQHLFEPFNRLGADREAIQGTGIGLVVTRRLIELMGGSLSVQSEVGVGSSFAITLAAGEAVAAARRDFVETSTDPTAMNRDQATVLYAEDDEVSAELAKSLFGLRPNCRLVVANSGRAAIELALTERPDIILLDMNLGDLTGFEVMQKLAGDPRTAHVPCVALSAEAMPTFIEAALAAGFESYVTKPVNGKALLLCVDRLLARRR